MTTPHEITLDESQRLVAEVPAGRRQIVIAGPGSGKTETAAALVQHLTDELGLLPGEDLLLVSFSRAAIAAMRGRMGRGSGAALDIRTVDSLASRLLDSCGVDYAAMTFDDRILRATDLIRSGNSADTGLSLLSHLVVDEVQDLVGVRAAFVLEVLRALPAEAGFTLLGDPAQAIYNFQIDGDHQLTSDEFLDAAVQLGAGRTRLSGSYRARSAEARAIVGLGQRLEVIDGPRRVGVLRETLAGVLRAGDVTDLATPVSRWMGRVALLCRTNGEALVAHEALLSAGRPTVVQAAAEERGLAPWLSDVLVGGPMISYAEFVERADAAGVDPSPTWRALKAVEQGYKQPRRIKLSTLAARLADGAVPTALQVDDPTVPVISTVHRAKGLEYDHVVLVNPDGWLPADATPDDAAVAFVALSRARDKIVAATLDLPAGMRRDRVSDRWISVGFKNRRPTRVEVRPTDLRSGEDPCRHPDVAAYLRSEVHEGDRVIARLDPRRSELRLPIFGIYHNDERVGTTTERFGRTLGRLLGGPSRKGRPWPDLDELVVDGFETRASADNSEDPSTPYFWRGPAISGLARFQWKGL